ncbi:hypothetical protein KSP40_PGU014470 [Platanthera guangdongensis]|uniref:Uncharacterized protein n=1 Tax=Platanthera guangdongensis TaxID=2320717 RepID=A0ABR2MGA6_9ASPA
MGKNLPAFTQEEMAVDEAQGFPKAYALLCRSAHAMSPLAHGPPLAFIPYDFRSQEASRAKELSQMFPIIDPDARPSSNPMSYVYFLWEKLDHLGNAGFDPELFRVDVFGNVLYLHTDSASPLAWGIDHWFPCSRGGKTLRNNLRILQWQVCRKKKNKLDLLIPWWDLQLGISVNQFLTMFASRNSDFRSRAFSFLFQDDGEDEDIPLLSKTHVFPQKFPGAKKKLGLAPAAIVSWKSSSDALVLKYLCEILINFFSTPVKSLHKEVDGSGNAFQRFKSGGSKENNLDDYENNSYLAISCARDSLRQRREMKKQQEAEINRLDEELNELKKKNDSERTGLHELEAILIKRRRRVERCRRLSEAQAAYRSLLEKMIRDVMHQTTVYKEQLRLNQAASSALMARLEAHRASCDSTENDLRRQYKQKVELEIQARSWSEQARKRLRIYDDLHDNSSILSSKRRHTKKEMREFLEAEQRDSEAGISLSFEEEKEWEEEEVDETGGIINEKHGVRESAAKEIYDEVCCNSDQKIQICRVEEGNDTALSSKDQKLIPSNKLKQIQHTELNNLNRNKSYKKNCDQKKGQKQEEKENEEIQNLVGK